jgi:hypothetical protein
LKQPAGCFRVGHNRDVTRKSGNCFCKIGKSFLLRWLVRSGVIYQATILPRATPVFDLHWTASEKKIARQAFLKALDRELAVLIEEKKMDEPGLDARRALGGGGLVVRSAQRHR